MASHTAQTHCSATACINHTLPRNTFDPAAAHPPALPPSGQQQHSLTASKKNVMIASPSPNDVLFGRGAAARAHEGNKLFRRLVHERKEEYTEARRNVMKATIAREVFDQIHALGGRFLKHVGNENPRNVMDKNEGGHYEEVYEAEALEKCMQALREKKVFTHGKRPNEEEGLDLPRDGPEENEKSETQYTPPVNSMTVLPADMFLRHLTLNANIALFQGFPWVFQQQPIIHQSTGLEQLLANQHLTTQISLRNQSASRDTNLTRPDASRSTVVHDQPQSTSVSIPQGVPHSTKVRKEPSCQQGDSGSSGVEQCQPNGQNSRNTQTLEISATLQEHDSDKAVSDAEVSEFVLRSVLGDLK